MANKITVRIKGRKRTFPTIKAAAEAFRISYITMYMRLRAGKPPSTAAKQPVRKYERRRLAA